MSYAQGTEVSPEKSQQEIASTVRRYGAEGFVSGWQHGQAMVEFMTKGRRVRFVLELPTDRAEFASTPGGKIRPPSQRQGALDAEVRRRWRALALAIKAKLEVVESGIAEFDAEFLANVVLPDGTTVAERVVPMVKESYDKGLVSGRLLAIGPAS